MSDDTTNQEPTAAIEFIIKNAKNIAQAKAERVYLEQFRKSKKALLMAASDAKTAVEREQEAYSHPDYIALLDGLKVAVENETYLTWKMTAAELRIDVWRTREASNRNQDRSMR